MAPLVNGKVIGAAALSLLVIVIVYNYQYKFFTDDHRESGAKPSEKQISVHDGSSSDLIFTGNSDIILQPDMSNEVADQLFFKYVTTLHFVCRKSERFGNILDGGWDLCLVPPFIPSTPCLVYSFGINNDFSFDDAIAKKFKCTIRSFDPSMRVGEHKRGQHISFYKIGLDGKNYVNMRNWNMMTLGSILDKFGESNQTIDYLKIDIEGSEWESIDSIVASGLLSRVRQLALEIHVHSRTTAQMYSSYLRLKALEDVGMRKWYCSQNYYNLRRTRIGFRTCCYELIYINTKFLPNWKQL